MRIGIEYTAAVRQRGGIGRYTRNLVRALSELDTDNEYKLFVAGGWGNGDGLGSWPGNFHHCSVPVSDRWLNILWQRARLPVPIQTIIGRLDLFHSPDFVLPPTGRTPTILTVHDLSFLRVPECYVPEFQRYLERAVSRAVHRADRILADSESTRADLTDLMAVDPDRIDVIYPGIESRFRPVGDQALQKQVREIYHLPAHFVMGLSTLQPRKNFAGLVAAFDLLVRNHSRRAEVRDVDLVVVGSKGWMYEEIFEAVARTGLEERIHFVGFVEDKDLPVVYSAASAFAFPSWYEGFGLPVLEAMACGTPVVAADNSSLPEVVGDAGLLVDAGDVEGLANGLLAILQNRDLCQQLTSAGLRQAARFRWSTAASQLRGIYGAF